MGIRLRRTLRIAPGLRLKLNNRGPTLSIGPRGANVNINRRGIHSQAGVPGSGIYHRQPLWKRKSGAGKAKHKKR